MRTTFSQTHKMASFKNMSVILRKCDLAAVDSFTHEKLKIK